MSAKAIIKIIFLVIITMLAIACVLSSKFFPESKYKNQAQRIRLIVRFRSICFIIMLVLLFIVIIVK